MTAIAATSTQYIWVPVRADHPISGATNLSTAIVEVAVVVGTPAPTAWKLATWESTADTVNGVSGYWLAKVKVGPAGAVTLTPGTHEVWIRLTTTDEAPVLKAGELTVY